jgi:glycosyltransferase involved in cell wall biosynthesis
VRICFVSEGISIHTQRWVNYFAKKGHDVHLICWRVLPGYDKNVHIHLLTRFPPKTWNLSLYLSALFWIMQVRQLIKKIKPEVVVGFYLTGMGYISACSGFQPLVVTAVGSDILIEPKRNLLWKFHARYAIRKARVVVYDSETMKRGLLELGAKPDKLSKVYNGVDTGKFSPQWRSEELRGTLGIANTPAIICFRNLRPVYNVQMLIRAIPLVLSQIPGARFIIGGDGEQREYLQDLARSLGVSQSVTFTGYIPHHELPKYLASSDIYISTSLSDSTSLSLQEAIACELAPVITDLPANREWVTGGENGFLVPTNNIEMLAERIVYLIKNEEVRKRFGKIGREIIKQRAEHAREMEKMERIYQGLLTDKRESS